MKKITEIIAFLFLSSLVFASGLFIISVQAQLNYTQTISQKNPPYVNAGIDRTGKVNESMALEGSAADDGTIRGLGWGTPAASCTLSATMPYDIGTSHARAVTAIICSVPGIYTAHLTAIDNEGVYATDELTLTIEAYNTGSASGTAVSQPSTNTTGTIYNSNTATTNTVNTVNTNTVVTTNMNVSSNTNTEIGSNTNTAPTNTASGNTNTSNTNQPATGTTNGTAQKEPTIPTVGIPPTVHTLSEQKSEAGIRFSLAGEALDDIAVTSLTWALSNPNCRIETPPSSGLTTSRARAEAQATCLAGSYTATLTAIDSEGLRTIVPVHIIIENTKPITTSEAIPLSYPPAQARTVHTTNTATSTPEEPQLPTELQKYASSSVGLFSQTDSMLARDSLEWCGAFSISDPEQCKRLIALNLPRACTAAHITTRPNCEAFLKKNIVEKTCDEKSIAQGVACEETLYRIYEPDLFCGDLSRSDCERLVKERLLGHVVATVEERHTFMNSFDAALSNKATLQEINEVLDTNNVARDTIPLQSDENRTLLIRRSDRTIDVSNKVTAEVTAPYILILDDDGDGVPNDLEARYGTDPKNSDTDNDGYGDRDEVANGYNPLSPAHAKSGRVLTTVEEVLLSGGRLEQPITNGETDAHFVVQQVLTLHDETGSAQQLSGTAEPNSVVLLYVYSRMPLVLTVNTDAAGNWVYVLKDTLQEGKHTVYVAVTDKTGKLTHKSGPASFFVQRAQAVSPADFLRSQASAPSALRNSTLYYYLIGGIGLIILGLSFFWFFMLRRKAHVA